MASRSGRLGGAMLASVLWMSGGGEAAAACRPDIDLSGSWQVDIDCSLFPVPYATATSFLQIERDTASGDFLSTIPRCGTLSIPGEIVEIADCVSEPDPTPIGCGPLGTGFASPPVGYVTSASAPVTPFPFPLLGCSAVSMIDASLRYDGAIAFIGENADRVTGSLLNGPLEMRESDGTSCFRIPQSLSCQFEMRRNEVREGSGVSVEPREGVRVTFAEVLSRGTVSVVPLTPLDAVLPPGFQNVAGELQVVFRLETTASFQGSVVACFAYEDVNQDGFVDATVPPIPEDRIRVLHEESGVFLDRTLRLDPILNEACASTSGFSRFALGKLDAERDPPRRRALASRGKRSLPRSPGR